MNADARAALWTAFLRGFTILIGLAAAVFMPGGAAAAETVEYQAGDIIVEQPWSRATLPGAKVAAGYLVVRNTGNSADRLLSVSSDLAERSEIHEMTVKDGVMTMRPLADGLEIGPGESVALEPGGYHLMFMNIERMLAEGDIFQATLEFEKAGSLAVEFKVEGRDGASSHGHGQKHNHD
jgi:copper(I)-binding protein